MARIVVLVQSYRHALCKGRHIFKPAYLNPLIPYLGKKIFRGSDWSAEKPQHCSQHIKRSYTLLGDKLLL